MPVSAKENLWSIENVKEQLRRHSGSDGVSAQVFLNDKVSADQLGATVTAAIEKVGSRLPGRPHDVVLGRINRLAKSVSVRGDAETIGELMREKQIKAVLPSQMADIYPHPVSKDPLPSPGLRYADEE